VFVVGHSLGGVLAPHIATRDGSLAGAVMLAPGPARPMAETVLDQRRHLLDQQNVTDEEREEALAELQKTAEKIRTLDIGDDEVLLSLGGREYFRTLAEYDGPKTAAGLEIPLFLAMGGRDYQITVENDLPIWREALSSASDVAIEVYDDLNHLFQQGEGPSTGREYYEPDAVFDRRVIEDVAAFVEQHA
jgi:pimeloyl-ACP methyl ester carboxylesterase